MRREAAERISKIASECSQRANESLMRVMETQDEEAFFVYRRRVGHIMSSLFDLMAPLWNEHLEIAPRWYQEDEERRACGVKPRIDPAMQRDLLRLMDEVEEAMASMAEIAAGAGDAPAAESIRQGAQRVGSAVGKARSYLSSVELRTNERPGDDPQ